MNFPVPAAAAKSLQSCPTLCNPIDGSPLGCPVPGILQARILEWVAISFSIARKWKVKVKLLSHVRLSDPMDCSLPGPSFHGIFQARVLEWGAIAFSWYGTKHWLFSGNIWTYYKIWSGTYFGPLNLYTDMCNFMMWVNLGIWAIFGQTVGVKLYTQGGQTAKWQTNYHDLRFLNVEL